MHPQSSVIPSNHRLAERALIRLVHFGKKAGILRNEAVVRLAERIVCFWDGESPGTRSVIDLAARYGKPCEVIRAEVAVG